MHLFARMLRVKGFEVLTVLQGNAALGAVETSNPDGVLLDLQMTCADSVAFLRQLRAQERGRPTPVAILTSDYFVDDATSLVLRELGAEVCFEPLWLEDIAAIVQRLVGRA